MEKITREEFAKRYGNETLNSIVPQTERRKSMLSKFTDFANKGGELAQGAVQSYLDVASKGGQFIGEQTVGRIPGVDLSQSNQALDKLATPTTKTMATGKLIGDVSQFLIPTPVGKGAAAAKTGGFFSRMLSKAGGLRGVAAETAKDTLLSTAQSSPETKPGDIAAGIGIGTAANILLPTVFDSVGSYLNRVRTPNLALKTLDDVAAYADEISAPKNVIDVTGEMTPGQLRSSTEAATPRIGMKEKLVGIDTATKSTLKAAGPQKMKEYIDVVVSRNNLATLPNGDVVPSALSYGSTYVNRAEGLLASKLNDTGSEIGQFRQKIATTQIPRDGVLAVKNQLDTELSKLNLQFDKNGKVSQTPGKISKVSRGDLSALQDLSDNYRIFSQSPTVENLIDLRMAFDSKIKFEKSARTVSNAVDPLSRSIRATIADVNRQAVGKSQAALLEEFSNLMDDLTELQSYTSRKAGSEFLLKRVLSERDREPRDLLKRVKEQTGIDLFQEATMVKTVTSLMGNADQTGLFKQEITNAGLDVANILTGGKANFIGRAIQKGIEQVLDEEAILMNASKGL